MAESLIDRLNRFLGGNPSVHRVADDLQLTSELILLVRMMFADGELQAEEMVLFENICTRSFGIPQKDVPQVVQYLKDFGYETTSWDAAKMFEEMAPDRKRQLLLHMLEIARADERIDAGEAALIKRTAEILGVTPADIEAARGKG